MCVYMSVCHMIVGVRKGHKKMLSPLKMEL